MIAWLIAATVAHAAPTAHYHPEDVARASQRFAEAQRTSGVAFQARQRAAEQYAAALNAYETQLDLLGDLAPADQRARHKALRDAFQRQTDAIVTFANEQIDVFDGAFGAALERALDGVDAEVCQDEPAQRGLRMGPRFGSPAEKEACAGDNISEQLAATMDADPRLKADLDALAGQTWPDLALDVQPVAPVGGDVTLDLRAMLRDHARDALSDIDSLDDEARLGIRAALEQGVTAAEQAALVEEARAITARTASRRAELAAPVIEAVDLAAAKLEKKRGVDLGWCPQPEALGGCTGTPATGGLRAEVEEHPKVRKALAAAATR